MKVFLYISWYVVTAFASIVVAVEFGDAQAVFVGLIIYLAFPIYFLPSFVAAHRKMTHRVPLFLGNLFLGGTGIGWILVMILVFIGKTDYDEDEPLKVRLVTG
jgi:fucose permease